MNIDIQHRLLRYLDILLSILGITSVIIFVLEIGFYLTEDLEGVLLNGIKFVVLLFILQEMARWFLLSGVTWKEHLKARWFENVTSFIILISVMYHKTFISWAKEAIPTLGVEDLIIAYLGVTQLTVSFAHLIRFTRETQFLSNLKIGPSRLFIISFIIPIIIGTLMLKMPKATVAGIGWIDSLFTVVSAICITGLATLDISQAFTPLGQLIILLLIQMGGLGIMTLTMTLGAVFSGALGVRERLFLRDMISEERMGEVGHLLARITIFTLVIESIGAALLFVSLNQSFEEASWFTVWTVVFHSISAFCNAGFSLFTLGLADPSVRSNYMYGSIIMTLVFLGGLGFPVISNLYEALKTRRRDWNRGKILFNSTSKLIIISTLLLLIGGTALVYITESNESFSKLSQFDKWYQSLFLSIASRTAGFNIWPTETLSLATIVVVCALMWIGGSPMSTAGGIKNLTFAVALLAVRAIIYGKERVEVFGKEISFNSVLRSFVVIFASLMTVATGIVLLCLFEPDKSFQDIVFEVFSAVATVGLSRGITPELSDASKLTITSLMFVGRMGFITVLCGLYFGKGTFNYKLLKENIPIS